MAVFESSPTTVLLLRNLATSFFIFADNSLVNFSKRYKLLEIIHRLLISSFLFFLGLLPSFSPPLNPVSNGGYPRKPPKSADYASVHGDCGISRALTQLLLIINRVPVSSRKYEVVRSLAEKLIDENHREGVVELREVNRAVLSAAFDRLIKQIESSIEEDGGGSEYPFYRVVKAVRSIGDSAMVRFGRRKEGAEEEGRSGEKLAAEVLWLAEKMAGCGCSDEACSRWASAARLGRVALAAEPRLQASLVKVAAFLFKQARDLDIDKNEEIKNQLWRQTKLKMLFSWLPLLCRGSNGTDTPVLSIGERREVETILEETIGTLQQDEQEQVLGVWLHHFTHSSSSDWPDLHASYAGWYNASRRLLIHHHTNC